MGKVNRKSQARDGSPARGIWKKSSALARVEATICAMQEENFVPAAQKLPFSSASFSFDNAFWKVPLEWRFQKLAEKSTRHIMLTRLSPHTYIKFLQHHT